MKKKFSLYILLMVLSTISEKPSNLNKENEKIESVTNSSCKWYMPWTC